MADLTTRKRLKILQVKSTMVGKQRRLNNRKKRGEGPKGKKKRAQPKGERKATYEGALIERNLSRWLKPLARTDRRISRRREKGGGVLRKSKHLRGLAEGGKVDAERGA